MTEKSPDAGLRIAVLVKHVPDPNQLTIDVATRSPVFGPDRVINTYDSYGLSAALDLRDRHGGSVTAISLGPPSVRDVIVRALATGADDGVHIERDNVDDLDSLGTATIMASTLRELSFDVVISGQTSDDIETGQVGGQLAECLGWPHISLVTHIARNGDHLEADRDAEGSSERLAIALPAVLLVLSGRDGTQRYPSLRGMIQAKRRPIATVEAREPDRPSRLSWSPPRAPERSSEGTLVKDAAPEDAAAQLVEWLASRKLIP